MLLELFLTFFKIGMVTFGGGYAMIPLIEEEIVNKKKWIRSEDIVNIFSIAQSAPGAIAINSSTIIGYKLKNKMGAIMATLGVIMPSFLIIVLIASFFSFIRGYNFISYSFLGINGAVVSLILFAAIKIIKSSVKNFYQLILMLISIYMIIFQKINPAYMILSAILLSFIYYFIKGDKNDTN